MSKLQFADFEGFSKFDEKILSEIIREGEAELEARLATANASDQRSLTIMGFQVTALAAASGAILVASQQSKLDKPLIVIGLLFCAGLFISLWLMYLAIMPKRFAFPGNSPHHWSIDVWHHLIVDEKEATLQKAKVEQCFCLYSALYDNKMVMEDNAALTKTALSALMATATISTILSVILVLSRLVGQ